MQTGRNFNKTLTSVTQQGVTPTGTPNQPGATPSAFDETTAGVINYTGEDESQRTLTGPGRGSFATSSGSHPQKWGHTSSSGSKIEVDDTPGGESISITHHTGAGIVVEPDGSIYISSESRRGGGIGAPFGDFYLSAGGDLVIRGAGSVSLISAGDLTLDIGGTLNIKCAAYNLITKNMDETIDGTASRSVTNDQSTVIGGLNRMTVAGDDRKQISGNAIHDVAGTSTTRIDGNTSVDVGGKHTVAIGSDSTTSIGGNHTIGISGDSSISASGDNDVYAAGNANMSGQGQATVFSGGPVKLTGSEINASPRVDRAYYSEFANHTNTAVVIGGPTAVEPPVSAGGSASAQSVTGPVEAKTAEANDIVDTLTSQRKYPQYIGNGVHESAHATNLGRIDQQPQADSVFDDYSGQNTGASNPTTIGGSYESLSSSPVDRDPNITLNDPGISTPARYNNSSKISRYFTLGQLVNASSSHKIPADSWDSVVKNHIKVAYNVLDPIKEKFPDIIVTSAYRDNSKNHITGLAIDLVCASRSMTRHAEIARFARDNLPVDQVLLERNTTGKTHVHVRAGSGSPTVLTCGDAKCTISTPGINVEYLVKAGAR